MVTGGSDFDCDKVKIAYVYTASLLWASLFLCALNTFCFSGLP